MNMNKITTHLWYDKEAKEAAALYNSVFKNSQIKNTSQLHDTPSGDVDIVNMEIEGSNFTLLSAGPYFKFTPAISLLVACSTKEEVDEIWSKLSPDGKVLMELATYPFSEWYGWCQDKYGLSWQIMYFKDQKPEQKITPTLMYTGAVAGKAEEAINFYVSIFKNSKVGALNKYPAGMEPDKEGTLMHGSFVLEGEYFAAMDSAHPHGFTFNEAISFIVSCKDQAEIDYFWEKLSAVPESEQCGWLKDKYGVSWQITPARMDEMMKEGSKEQIERVTKAFLQMKKFDIAKLEEAYKG